MYVAKMFYLLRSFATEFDGEFVNFDQPTAGKQSLMKISR